MPSLETLQKGSATGSPSCLQFLLATQDFHRQLKIFA